MGMALRYCAEASTVFLFAMTLLRQNLLLLLLLQILLFLLRLLMLNPQRSVAHYPLNLKKGRKMSVIKLRGKRTLV